MSSVLQANGFLFLIISSVTKSAEEPYSKENSMPHVTSKDGTIIAFDQIGQGPAFILVGCVLGDRSGEAPLADLLAEHFTVFNYDRRGHGESGYTCKSWN